MSEIGDMMFPKEESSDFGKHLNGLVIGVVSKNYNQQIPDQVEIEIPIGGSSKTMRVWARHIRGAAGNNYGIYDKPEIGDVAVVGFIEGNTSRPIILGYLYKKGAQIVTECANEKNTLKKYKTPTGTEVIFENNNKKESLTITTKNKQQIILDEEKEEIRLLTAQGKNYVNMQGKEGTITLEGKESLHLKVGQSEITLNKDGSIEISCKNLKVGGKPNIKVDGNTLTVNGIQVNVKGTAGVKIESSAMLQAKGQIVKLG